MFSTGLVELYLSPTTNHWHKPATSVLRSPRESYDSGSSCKNGESVKHTWTFLIFLALKMWLTWYQVVDHVWHSQSNMAKGMCSIDDSLNTKACSFFETPFPSSWARNPRHPSKHAHQSLSQNLPSIDLPPHRLCKDSIYKVRCHKLFSHYTRSIGTSRNMYVIYLPIRSRLSTWWQEDFSSESSTPCNLLSYERIQARLRELILRYCNAIIRLMGPTSIPSQRI